MRKKPKDISKTSPRRDTIMEYMKPFFPLIQRQMMLAWSIEAETNKRFHLGTKEFEYVSTITGHIPVHQKEQQTNE